MELPVIFECADQHIVGILSEGVLDTGVVIIVGGPQYRVGSHRQFTLLARQLAKAGIPCLRFDYRGMGDSGGEIRDFEDVQLDIQSAVDYFFQHSPGLKRVVLWGLCDAASASIFYGYTDERVSGLVLLNPWVRTIEGEARAYIKHYYMHRLIDKSLWQKIFSGKFNFYKSIRSLYLMITSILKKTKSEANNSSINSATHALSGSLPERMLQGLQQFNGKILLILSGDDLTADEFRDVVGSSREWKRALESDQITMHTLDEANHTFSSKTWRNQVETWTVNWLLDNEKKFSVSKP